MKIYENREESPEIALFRGVPRPWRDLLQLLQLLVVLLDGRQRRLVLRGFRSPAEAEGRVDLPVLHFAMLTSHFSWHFPSFHKALPLFS